MFSDLYESVIDFFTPDEAKKADDLEVEEDVDLWDLFQCWLWGEKNIHSTTNSKKQDSAGGNNPGDNSFKSHKRKEGEDDGEGEEEEEEDEGDVGVFARVFNLIRDILQDDGKSRQHGSRGR